MSLPPSFEEPIEYFEECLEFFNKYEHLFNFPNTDILVRNVLDTIKVENIINLDVYKADFDLHTLNSVYLKDFFNYLNKLRVINYDEFKHEESLELLIDVPLSPKKKHEIIYLAKEVDILCKDIGCDTVIDFGSGLGYLDQQIFEVTNCNVLGLECNEDHYVGSKKRQRKYHLNSIERVKYIKHTISSGSSKSIEEYLKDKFPNSDKFCIAGLHACADLTIDAVNIFLKMEKAHALIIMPCCYHRIMVANKVNGRFKNFPLSNTLRNVYEKYSGFKFLTVPFLRLAAQSPNLKTEKLEYIVFNLLARAVLQVYGRKHNCVVKRNKRKAVSLKLMENDFGIYAKEAIKGFKLYECNEGGNDMGKYFDIEELLTIWNQISQFTFKKAAIFVLLQNTLQPVLENFVLYDRLVYLQENGIKNCTFKRITNESISPRCFALLAKKNIYELYLVLFSNLFHQGILYYLLYL